MHDVYSFDISATSVTIIRIQFATLNIKENQIEHCLIKKFKLIAILLSIEGGLEILNMKCFSNSPVQVLRISPLNYLKILKINVYPLRLTILVNRRVFVHMTVFIYSSTPSYISFPNIFHHFFPLWSVIVH